MASLKVLVLVKARWVQHVLRFFRNQVSGEVKVNFNVDKLRKFTTLCN